MNENIAGLVKIIGITVLLVLLWIILSVQVPDKFLTSNNIENLLRRTALYGVLGIGVAFVIISSGIDLSIGSLVCLAGCLFALFLHVSYDPMQQDQVWQLDNVNHTILVQADQYEEGDQAWFYRDRTSKGTIEITRIEKGVEVSGREFHRLHFKGDIRGKSTAGIAVVGTLSPTHSLSEIAGDSVRLDSNAPTMNVKDKLRFVHLSQPTRERAIKQIASDGRMTLDSTATGITTEYRVVLIQRSAVMSVPMAALTVLLIGLGLGFAHGLLITRLNQQPFIITLCGLMIYRGIARRLANDQPQGFIEYGDSLGAIANGRWILWGEGAESFGIPYSFFVLAALTVLAIIVLNFTIWGRYLKALGRNEEAARYSGINTRSVTMMAYVVCAVLAAFGGMMFAIDANSVSPASFGNFFELYAIAAAVLGGCSLRGGEGSILGVVVGTALMQTLYNSIVLLGIPDTLEFTIIGSVILIGVVSDEVVRRITARMRR